VHSDFNKLPYEVPRPYAERFMPRPRATFTGCDGNHGCATRHLVALDATGQPVERRDLDYIRELYDAGIAFTDEQVGQLIAKLKELGLYDRTLVIVIGDHGEELREHGRFLHTQLYDEIARVPFIMSYPPLLASGRRVSVPTSLLDLRATVLEVAGLSEDGGSHGQSLLPVLRGGAPAEKPVVTTGLGEHGLRDGQWKLIVKAPTQARELYDLAADPGERHNLAAIETAHADRLAAQLRAWIAENRTRAQAFAAASQGGQPGAVTASDADLDRLRNLGYLQ
jgi:choline-sulfatase